MQNKELIKALIKRDPSAQAEVYHRYKTRWFSICLRYQSRRYDAEDCLQNALIKIFTKVDQFDINKGSFLSWTSRIVVNENLQFLKKNLNFSDLEAATYMLQSDDNPNIEANPLSMENITGLIQQLPEGYRTVFNLYVLDGFTHGEIASILGISVGTSKSQLSKARKLLQHQLEVVI